MNSIMEEITMLRLLKDKWLVTLSFLLGVCLLTLDVYVVFTAIGTYFGRGGIFGVLSGLGGIVFAYVLIVWSFLFIIAPFNKNSKLLGVTALILIIPAGLVLSGIQKISNVLAKITATLFTLIFSASASWFLYILIGALLPKQQDYNASYYYLLAVVGSYTFVSIGRWLHNTVHEFFLNDKLPDDRKMSFDQASFWVAAVSLLAFLFTSYLGSCFSFSEKEKALLDAVKDASGVFAQVNGFIALGRLLYGKVKQPTLEQMRETLKRELYAEIRESVLDEIKKSGVIAFHGGQPTVQKQKNQPQRSKKNNNGKGKRK